MSTNTHLTIENRTLRVTFNPDGKNNKERT